MKKKVIYSENVPEPIGTYSQAIRIGDLMFASGQIAIDPQSGKLVLDSIEKETHQVMNNIKSLLATEGLSLSSIVKTSIFLKDMKMFSKINEVYGAYFEREYPARETVEVSCLPKNVNVEISIIASY